MLKTFEDKLGLLIDTAMQPADDDPSFSDKGYTSLLSPKTKDASEENDDDAAFQGLREAGLSPKEAQADVDYMRPLDKEEADILDSIPLEGLTKVDDAEHQQFLAKKVKAEYKGIDSAFDDAIYGDTNMNHNEERMEREDTDSGSWWKKALSAANPISQIKKLNPVTQYRQARRMISSPFQTLKSAATMPFRQIASVAKHFIPNRDAGKAAIVRNTYRKLWYEHANWLAQQDAAAGLALKPRAQYEYIAKLWAKDQLQRGNLPVSLAAGDPSVSCGGRDELNRIILGSEMGAWFWPFSWFQKSSTTIINNTADKRSDAPPDSQSDAAPPAYQAVQPPMDDGSQMPPEYAQQMPPGYDGAQEMPPGYNASQETPYTQQGKSNMNGWNNFVRTRGLSGVFGPDSLGAYATQILGKPEKKIGWKNESDPDELMGNAQNPHAERIVRMITLKLKTGKPISPGELGLLSSAAKEGNTTAQQVIVVLEKRGAVVSGDSSGSDPWLYKLNPAYWFSSKKKQEFTDIEKKKWVENAALQKQLKKQQEDLDEAEKAVQATRAVEMAKAQSAATEAKLKEIAASLKGEMSGSFVGHEKNLPLAQVVVNALGKAGKKESAGHLYGKIKAGQSLDKNELQEARKIAQIIGRMKVVHGDLIDDQNEALTMHGAFVGACVLGAIDTAQDRNAQDRKYVEYMSQKLASGQPATQMERQGLAKTLKNQAKLNDFSKALVSGKAFVGCKQAKAWSKASFLGAAKAMNDEDKKMLSAIVKLAKVGNPRAQKALIALKQSGDIAGDSMGFNFNVKKFFHYATAPVWLPAKGLYKGAQAFGLASKGGGGGSPEQQRLAMMAAAAKRRQAAEARAAAADAQSEAEQRAQLAIAAAADAEADAKDAEALAKEQAMKTKEVQADPSSLATADDSESGTFIGEDFKEFIGKESKEAKILAKANEQSATGIKVRAGARLYKKAKLGDPQAVRAVRTMVAKAKKGDPQALRDVNAVKAGRIAVQARTKVERKKTVASVREARRLKVVAIQKRYEARAANKLVRMSRTRQLKQCWMVERKAAAGNPRAKTYVSKQVALSKRGDKKALARVQAMQQGRLIRQKVRTPREARNMKSAERFVSKLQRNNPKALRQYEILKAAANKGNPNAIRAIDRIMLAAMVVSTVTTGVVATSTKRKKSAQKEAARRKAHQQVAMAQRKAASGTASREELAAGAKAAHALGDQETAGQMAMLAAKAPSVTESLRQKAATVAAAEAGNPEAKAELQANLASAKKGDAGGIKEIAKTMAVDTVDKINNGQEIPQTMKDALALNERIKAGDPVAVQAAKEITTQATAPNAPAEATLAAGALVAAQSLNQSLAAKPQARAELMAQATPPIPDTEKEAAEAEVAQVLAKANDGTVTAAEGQQGIALALRLGKPKLAAMISAKAPPPEENESPMASLPDQPLTPITGAWKLLKESLKALAFATPDPIANYRGALVTRSKLSTMNPPTAAMGTVGWSPFSLFTRSLPGMALASMPVMAATSLASLFKKQQPQTVKVQMVAPPVVAATPTGKIPAAKPNPHEDSKIPAAKPNPHEDATESSSGIDRGFKEIVTDALQAKKMSKKDFNKAIDLNVGPEAEPFAKKVSGEHLLNFLKAKNVTVGGEFIGKDKDFKEYIVTAVKAKKMSKDDFNKAIDVHCGPNSSKESKVAAGEKVLKFLKSKSVAIG